MEPAKIAPTETEPEVIKWRVQSFTPVANFEYQVTYPRIIEEIEKKTGGRLDITLLPSGAVCPPAAMFDTVAKGGIEAIFYSGPFYSGTIPVANVEHGLPFAWEDGYELNELLYKHGLIDVYRKAYEEHNIHLAGVWVGKSWGLMTKFPVHSLEDLKGHRIRAVGPSAAMLVDLGVATVATPFAELYMTLERGITEGTCSAYTALGAMNLREVVDYSIFPPLLNPDTLNFLVNLDEWNKLSPDIQEAIEQAIIDLLPSLWEVAEQEAHDNLKVAQEQHGHTIITLPDSEVAKLKEIAVSHWKKIAEIDDYCKEAVDIIIEWNKQKGRL
jgi:TRAP-type C4-dicarboxylate transport system substrate-binding protein